MERLNGSDERLGKKEAAARLQLEFPTLQSNGKEEQIRVRRGALTIGSATPVDAGIRASTTIDTIRAIITKGKEEKRELRSRQV
ncbi:hypothetical protein QLX08_002217 [Tetragonisca angustula]|uniref:Uncharacterized protein n=1 Tax=Tetragonisca angustula TaxID=166442 RepID=A0AAW1AEY5_9HYME